MHVSSPISPYDPVRNKRVAPYIDHPRSPKRMCAEPSILNDSASSRYPRHSSLFEETGPDLEPPITPNDPSIRDRSALLPHAVDKFTKSRAVGQSHRDNEKEHVELLHRDVEDSRRENILLFALFACRYKTDRGLPVPSRLLDGIHTALPHDLPEDCHIHDDQTAARRGMYKLSEESARRLGQRYISPALAVVLLELMIYRRNMVPDTADPTDQPLRRRRRRSTYRTGTSKSIAKQTVNFAISLFAKEYMGGEDPVTYMDRRLGSLAVLRDSWCQMECHRNPVLVLEEEEEDTEYSCPPSSPTRPEAAEFGSPLRRRGEGAKRCSRCNMLKYTGSGHGRSKCDDGYSISSLVPYPASPRSDGHRSN